MKKILLAAATAGVLALFSGFTPLQAQTIPSDQVLFGITFFQNQLISIDTKTGEGTLVGDIGSNESGYGLATYNGNLYTFNQNTNHLDELSKIDGRVMKSIPLGLMNLAGEGDLVIGSSGTGYLASAFDSAGNPTHPFYTFNVTSGTAVLLGHTSVVIDGLALSGSGTLPTTLYALGQGEDQGNIGPASAGPELYKVDPADGTLIPVGPTGVAQNSPVAGLAFSPDGTTLYAAIDDKLYTLDPSTGQATLVDANTPDFSYSSVSGIAFATGASVLSNLSSRAQVLAGNDPLISGFIIGAENPGAPAGGAMSDKMLIIRGIGPSLAIGSQPLSGRLRNPTLSLYDSQGTKIATNDDWMQNTPADQTFIRNQGLAPGSPKESVIVAAVPAGAYTAILRGVNDGTGIGLVEVYDVNQGNGLKTGNLSARALVAPGDDALISGLTIEGAVARRTLVRGLGPSLAQYGVTNPLPDPELMAYDANGTVVETNDNWMQSSEAADIKASGLAPADPKEAVIDRVFQPGAYTFVLTGVGNDATGTALIGAYDRNSSD